MKRVRTRSVPFRVELRSAVVFAVLLVLCALPVSAANEEVSVTPPNPTELDDLTVTLSGEWPDSCTPQLVGAELANGILDVEAIIQFPDAACADVISPYQVSIEVGPLPPGDYLVRVSGIPNFPPAVVIASTELEITESGDLGLERIDVAPRTPSTQDRVTIAATGTWSDGCVPGLDGVEIEERTIRLLGVAEGEGCVQVLTPFALIATVGPLEEGAWRVEVLVADRRAGDVGRQFELAGERAFTVVPSSSNELVVGGRFAIRVTWNDGGSQSGVGQPIRGALPERGETGSGAFWFFGPENTELLIKVLDGCGTNDHFWVFISAATDLGYEVVVEDRAVDGLTWTYSNEPGSTAVAVTDVEAFATCAVP